MSKQVWLITGAARGLGKGFVSALLQRSHTTVIAAVRDTTTATAAELSRLPTANDSKVVIVKIDSNSDTDPRAAVEELQSLHGITHIDVVIVNAAAVAPMATVADASIDDFRHNFQVNAFAPVLLFQATWPLLQKSRAPKFIGISTCIATIGKMEDYPWPVSVYGSSKAAMNFIVKKIGIENEGLITFVIHPGFVQTDQGNSVARSWGREKADDTIEDSAGFVLNKIDKASKDNISGTFQFYGRDEGYVF